MKTTLILWIIGIIIFIPIIYNKIYWPNLCMEIYVKELIKNNNLTWYLYTNPNHIDIYYMEEFNLTWYSKWCIMYSNDIRSDLINIWWCSILYYYFKLLWD